MIRVGIIDIDNKGDYISLEVSKVGTWCVIFTIAKAKEYEKIFNILLNYPRKADYEITGKDEERIIKEIKRLMV